MGCGPSNQAEASNPASTKTLEQNKPNNSAPANSSNKQAAAVEEKDDGGVKTIKGTDIPIDAEQPKPDNDRFYDTYEVGDVLGEGAFSVVRLAKNKKNGTLAAVKCIVKKTLPADDEAALKQEVVILKSLNHPNVIKCYHFYDEEEHYYLVMEYLAGGELFDRIVKKTFYNEKEARDVVFTLLTTIHYLHCHNVVHRDLKPENLLMTSPDDDAGIKLADFGFAIKAVGYSSLKTQCGTPGYVAPEILSTQPYGKPVDMWSIGVITYILLGGYPPFHDDNQKILFAKIKSGEFEFHPEYWNAVSEEAKDLIRKLLRTNPLERYTAEEALRHSWITRDADELAQRNLDQALGTFKKFHATRKFKAAAKAIMAAKRMENIIGGLKNAKATLDQENNDE